jgi:putative NADPH-quinone reductase
VCPDHRVQELAGACAHSLKSLERNILKFCGIKPVRETLFGMVDAVSDKKRSGWL